MDTYSVLSLLLGFGMFLIALISYLDRNNNQKNNHPAPSG